MYYFMLKIPNIMHCTIYKTIMDILIHVSNGACNTVGKL